MHSQYVGVAMTYLLRICIFKKNYTFKKNSIKKMLPMLTMVTEKGNLVRQDNIIHKCTKLHDHSSNRK